ncbi:hypothetical protein LS68_008135 [Helicobacter sp. MIT 05-5293]|uniref:RCC1 domain-containing protein n=1 Tax=Helicobacter sp. MIT 05-5293 TaxID=1548149 RepID=UPI00051CC746|nr:hypothetical protein [Helicobacter sp. MIT 05-5293]TLD80177.1 hypothetical protein LS68_008135 [Helicobacter sp. MIT 05-5293]
MPDNSTSPNSTTLLYDKLNELHAQLRQINQNSIDELSAQAMSLKVIGANIKNEILSTQQNHHIYKKSYRLLKQVHLYRSLMVQEVLINSEGEIVHYGDVLMRGHSLSNVTSGASRTHYAGFTRICLPKDIEFIEVFGGHNVFYALPKEGNFIYAWGVNTSGCAGSGNTNNIPLPIKINLGFRPLKILSGTSETTGKQTTLILSEDGKVYGAGSNACGELAIGNTINTSTFTQSPYLRDIIDIAFASNGTIGYALAIDKEGSLWSWGYNGSGNLGLNHTNNVSIPAKITFNAKVKQLSISVGTNAATSLIVLEDKSIRGAGYNAQYQLSQSNTSNSSVFLRILKQNGEELDNIKTAFSSSINGTAFALDEDSNLWSWGYGGYGFGDNRSGNNQMASIALENIESLCFVDRTATRVFAKLKDASDLLAFGFNTDGTLGIGTTTNTREFTQVYTPPHFKDYHLYFFGNEANLIALCDDGIYSCGAYLDGNINIATQTLQKQS